MNHQCSNTNPSNNFETLVPCPNKADAATLSLTPSGEFKQMLTSDQFDDAVRGVLKNLAALEHHVLAIGVDWQGPTKAFDAFTEARNYFEAKSLTAKLKKTEFKGTIIRP